MLKMRVRQIKEVEILNLGKLINRARVASDKSLEQICDEVGVSRTYWYDLEKEVKHTVAIETLRKIEQSLGVEFGVTFD